MKIKEAVENSHKKNIDRLVRKFGGEINPPEITSLYNSIRERIDNLAQHPEFTPRVIYKEIRRELKENIRGYKGK